MDDCHVIEAAVALLEGDASAAVQNQELLPGGSHGDTAIIARTLLKSEKDSPKTGRFVRGLGLQGVLLQG